MKKSAVLFPGQGAQSVGMGRDVAAAYPAAAEVFERADASLGFGLSRLCFEGTAEELTRTDVQQPAIFTVGVAIWRALESVGAAVEPVCAAGLSLGEYTALQVAGAVGFEDGLRLVRRRGELMQEAAAGRKGAMASVIGGDPEKVRALCEKAAEGETLSPANYNCPGQIVISGAAEACERAVSMASEFGLRAVLLKVAGAFHSALMAPAAEGLSAELEKTAFQCPSRPVYSNVTGQPHGNEASIKERLAAQLTEPVLWQDSIRRMIADGVTSFVEVGPGRILTGLLRKIDRSVECVNVQTAGDIEKMATTVGRS